MVEDVGGIQPRASSKITNMPAAVGHEGDLPVDPQAFSSSTCGRQRGLLSCPATSPSRRTGPRALPSSSGSMTDLPTITSKLFGRSYHERTEPPSIPTVMGGAGSGPSAQPASRPSTKQMSSRVKLDFRPLRHRQDAGDTGKGLARPEPWAGCRTLPERRAHGNRAMILEQPRRSAARTSALAATPIERLGTKRWQATARPEGFCSPRPRGCHGPAAVRGPGERAWALPAGRTRRPPRLTRGRWWRPGRCSCRRRPGGGSSPGTRWSTACAAP